jgi:hypothetical protein
MSSNTRLVLIGGFLGDKRSLEVVAGTLSNIISPHDAAVFSFAETMNNPARIGMAAHKAYVITHSAGMLGLGSALEYGSNPDRVTAFAPPMPRSIRFLMMRSFEKTRQMHMTSNIPSEAIKRYERGSAHEALVHPYGNFRHLARIAATNSLHMSEWMVEMGTSVELVHHDDDVFYELTAQERLDLDRFRVCDITIPGIHDELMLQPFSVWNDYEQARA